MNDALGGEPFHHPPGGQLVVLGAGKQAGDGFEGFDEAGEVSEVIEGPGLGERERFGVVATAQLDEGRRRDGAFEVQVEFGLGEAADKRRDVVHEDSLAAGFQHL